MGLGFRFAGVLFETPCGGSVRVSFGFVMPQPTG